MNILFVNYGDFTTNSLNHIGGFANSLCTAGHACVVAVPKGRETISHLVTPLFIPATFTEVLATRDIFPNSQPADTIHAWTPREAVRKFVLAYQQSVRSPARLIIHLEDNERFLLEAYTGKSFHELRDATAARTKPWLVDALSHPVRHASFLAVADGVTHIVDRLREFAPPGTPTQLLPPGIDFTFYHPQPAPADLRRELGLRPDERVLVFTGSNTFANEPEMRELYLAVALLNSRNLPTRLIRTGFNSPKFIEGLPPQAKQHVIDLGFVEKARLPQLLALADVLVQPGHAGPFNDFRLPSKLPEFLAMGKPVVLPATNLGLLLEDGSDAVLLRTGTPDEIAEVCARLFAAPELCRTLGENASAFARRYFDLSANTAALSEFYTATLSRPAAVDWTAAREPSTTEASLLAARLGADQSSSEAEKDELSDVELLRRLVRDLEQNTGVELGELRKEVEAERATTILRDKLMQQHIDNLDGALRSSQQHNSALEQSARHAQEQLTLTRQHATNLEQAARHWEKAAGRLEAELATARGEASILAKSLADNQARAEAQRAHLRAHGQVLVELADQRTRDKAAALARETQRIAERDDRIARLESQLQELAAVIRQRDDKVQRMQQSASWQMTAPLRAARRKILDRRAATAAAVVAPPPRVVWAWDQPSFWDAAPASAHIRGWCVGENGEPVSALRLQIDDQPVSGRYGLPRPDVAQARGGNTSANCGFEIPYRLPVGGAHRVVLEIQTPDGNWHTLEERMLQPSNTPRDVHDYKAWVQEFSTLTAEKSQALRRRLEVLRPEQRPLISVLMPVYNPPEKWLVRAIESVREQVYARWELCLADDASTAPHVRAVLERFAALDARVRVVFRPKNGHISHASNSALELVQGEFTALLDHDDELAPDALAEVVLALADHPDTDLLYTDEDKIDESGERYAPYFKPDYLPDLFVGQNCISHLTVYRTALMRAVGGFRAGYEGSQDWDLALRVVEQIDAARVHHLPKVLYHWRAISGSTALEVSEKNYTLTAARRALHDHFQRRGLQVEIHPVPGNHWRVAYPLPEKRPLVSIIVPTRNAADLVRLCVASLVGRTEYPAYEILIVNNRSDDPAALTLFATLGREENIRVIDYDAPFNYSALNNFAAQQARGELLCFLNNDIEVLTPGWLTEMVSHAVRPEIGAVGAMLYYPDDTIQHAGVVLGLGGVANHAFVNHPRGSEGYLNRGRLAQNYSAVTAACLLVRRAVFEQVGGFNAIDLAIAFNDIDLCLRIRAAGYRNLWTPFAEFYHRESASRGKEDTPEKQARFEREVAYMRRAWGPLLDRDPAYSPNLALNIVGWALAWPPRS